MKKLILLLLCTATLGLVSCKKETIIRDPETRTIVINVAPGNWISNADGSTLTKFVPIQEIDAYNVDIEGILVYLDHPAVSSSYIQLPYTYNGETFTYEHLEGGINLDIQRAAYATENPIAPTGTLRLKVVLIPSVDAT
jgi:hypothetical protein